MLSFLKQCILDALFPLRCLVCASLLLPASTLHLCDSCYKAIPRLSGFYCPVCTARKPTFRKCHPRTPFMLTAATSYAYEPIRTLIATLKFEKRRAAAPPLATLLYHHLQRSTLPRTVILIPIPLHPLRKRERGYNQVELVAEELMGMMERNPTIHYMPNVLVRTRYTEAQTTQTKALRENNVAGAFAVMRPNLIARHTLILLDDVYTSGATMTAAAYALTRAGATRIIGLVIARA